MSIEKKNLRAIRSFVRREGRMTPSQSNAFIHYWPVFGASLDTPFSELFSNDSPVVLEIGFGMGHALLAYAQQFPQWNFIGIDVHRPGVGAVLNGIEQLQLKNIRLFCHDAVEILQQVIPDHSLMRIHIFFPDPWHKTRHHKRRLIQPAFISMLAQKLKQNGVLHLATDWENYAEHMKEVLVGCDQFVDVTHDQEFLQTHIERPITKFEKRGQRLGHGVWDLLFIRL